MSQSKPAICDEALQDALAAAAEALTPGRWQHMPSGAGHDAQYMARKVPVGDAVRPQHRRHQPPLGRGHQSDEDLAMGFRVLHEAARRALAG